jgi:hypothetical protein
MVQYKDTDLSTFLSAQEGLQLHALLQWVPGAFRGFSSTCAAMLCAERGVH